MINFLEETINAIKDSNHEIKDIIFIGDENSGYCCTWEQFEKLANKYYDSGFGETQVCDTLKIVFSDGQKMWRGGYDGAEWWEHSTLFKTPIKTKQITNLFTKWLTFEEYEEKKRREESQRKKSSDLF